MIWHHQPPTAFKLHYTTFSSRQMELSDSNAADEEGDPMLPPEMEAAQALAALARCSPALPSSEDQAVAAFHENKYSMVRGDLISGVTDRNVPTKLCCKSNRWNSSRKLRKKMTEDEKEKRRLRRILANRESARQTIRRRQAMHLELVKKSIDLIEENENLKKEKRLAVEKYNSLKGRNNFLKLQVVNAKKAEPRDTKEEPKAFQVEKPTAATISSPMFLYSQPPLVPFFWPSVPSSNAVHLQNPSHLDAKTIQNVGMTGPVNPLFVFPVPWAIPFPSYGTLLHSCSDTKKRQNETPPAHQCSMSSTSDSVLRTLPKEEPVICHHKKPVFAATKARRRRKELLMLKNVQCPHTRIHNANLQVG